MTDTTTPSATPAEPAVSTTPEQSLETIAKDFSIEEQATQFQAQPQPAVTAPVQAYQQQIPDPVIDQEGYRRYMQGQTQMHEQIRGTISTLNKRLEDFERQQTQTKIDADVNHAVTKVNEKLKVDPLMAEIALEKLYRTDVNFKRIWDNRDKNRAAFDKALDVVAQKLSPTFAVRQDPQLTENKRAAQQSQRTMASTSKSDIPAGHEGLHSDNPVEFERAWESFKRGMNR